ITATFGGQEKYAQKMIDEFKAAGVDPNNVFAQSFNADDIVYWIQHEPRFGKQAVYLDDIDPTAIPPVPALSPQELQLRKARGVRIVAPQLAPVLSVTGAGEIVCSDYAQMIKSMGVEIITWTFERADLRRGAPNAGFYYYFDPHGLAVKKDSDMYKALDVL